MNLAKYLTIAIALVVPSIGRAGVIVSINDLAETGVTGNVSGFDPASLNIQALLESFDLHGEYSSQTQLADGHSVTANFNFLEPTPCFELGCVAGSLSDTLNIVFTGHAPVTGDQNNLSVDLHFRSNDDGNAVSPLAGAFTLNETGGFQDLSRLVVQSGGPVDFQISVASDTGVPEPATLLLFGSGLALTCLAARRKRAWPLRVPRLVASRA